MTVIFFIAILIIGYRLFSGRANTVSYRVIRIIDGDSVVIESKKNRFEARLVGIDAPEMPDQPYALEAKLFLSSMIKNKYVRIRHYAIDPHNRLVSEIYLRNQNINLLMMETGYAEVYNGEHPKQLKLSKYINAEKRAFQARKNIWSQGSDYISPVIWRRYHM